MKDQKTFFIMTAMFLYGFFFSILELGFGGYFLWVGITDYRDTIAVAMVFASLVLMWLVILYLYFRLFRDKKI